MDRHAVHTVQSGSETGGGRDEEGAFKYTTELGSGARSQYTRLGCRMHEAWLTSIGPSSPPRTSGRPGANGGYARLIFSEQKKCVRRCSPTLGPTRQRVARCAHLLEQTGDAPHCRSWRTVDLWAGGSDNRVFDSRRMGDRTISCAAPSVFPGSISTNQAGSKFTLLRPVYVSLGML